MISNYLNKNRIKVPLDSVNKNEVIGELTDLLCNSHGLHNRDEIYDAMVKRERDMSTGVGHGLAIPHAKIDSIEIPLMVAGISPGGIDFESVDGRPAYIFIMLLSPTDSTNEHVRILSELSMILNSQEARSEVLSSSNSREFLSVIKSHEESL